MELSFKKGRFFLSNPSGKPPASFRDRWTRLPNGGWETSDLRAAVHFHRYADPSAKVILKRILLRYYTQPSALPEEELLDQHQRDGVRWILTRSRSYLAHAPGAGKTIQAIVAAKFMSCRTLILCPPFLVENWRREIAAWGHPHRARVHVVRTQALPENVESHAWIICPDSIISYSKVLRAVLALRCEFFIADEASRFKDPRALRTRAVFGGRVLNGFTSPGLIGHTTHAVLLDGSPMPNRPMELWAPLYAMAPEVIDFMGETEFGFRYGGPRMNDQGQWEFRGASRLPELHEKITERFMHVVNEDELSHPERRRRILFVTEDVRTPRMRNWEEQNMVFIQKKSIGEPQPPKVDGLSAHLHELGMQKAAQAAAYALSRIQQGETVLIFFWHRDVGMAILEALSAQHGVELGYVDGLTAMAQREQVFERFQAGWSQVIIGNIAVMGRGINLQRADRIIFAEYAWSDETNKQAEKRASRRGNNKLVVPCDYLCAPGSLDELVLRTLFRKQKLVEKVIQ